jgi:hypothetical protein
LDFEELYVHGFQFVGYPYSDPNCDSKSNPNGYTHSDRNSYAYS